MVLRSIFRVSLQHHYACSSCKVFARFSRNHSNATGRKQVSFEGFLATHLTEIKTRYKLLSDQLAASTSNSEIARLGKESASLSHIVELIDERITVLQVVKELQQLEKDERSK